MSTIYWYDRRFLPDEEVHISPLDRGYYFGDGIYEVFRIYEGRLFEAEAHFERLFRSAQGIKLTIPYSISELQGMAEELVARNAVDVGIVYLQFTRGTAPRNHLFPADADPVGMAYAASVPRPKAAMEQGITAITHPDTRWLHCDLKTLNLLANVLAKQEASDQGAADSILHRDGIVTESSASNVMIVKNDVIVTHPANHLILHGITRAVTLRLARAAEMRVEERPFTTSELFSADEAFVTGTTVEVTPIISIDGRPVGSGQPGPITRRLQQEFEAAITLL